MILGVGIISVPATEAHYTVSSTAYCLHGTMSDGSYTRSRSVANNFLWLGAWIKTERRVFSKRYFQVRDHIGWGTQLDFWSDSCGAARSYGRRTITIHPVSARMARRGIRRGG